jgi:hypothetical protein
MSSDFAVQPATPVRIGTEAVDAAEAVAFQQLPRQEPAPSPSLIPNPTLRLDPALGIVVIEFRNGTGAVTTSIPSERQLQAYQKWKLSRVGPAPTGRTACV